MEKLTLMRIGAAFVSLATSGRALAQKKTSAIVANEAGEVQAVR